MSFSPEEKARLQELLPKLRAQYDSLIMGERPTEVRDQNGELVRYAPPTADQLARLRNRIIEVESLLGIKSTLAKPARRIAFS